MTAIVSFEQVCKQFGDLRVLKGVDLEAAQGEKISIIGPSGSGKSTILRLLMCLERPTSGAIRYQGELLWPEDGERKMTRVERRRQPRFGGIRRVQDCRMRSVW